MTAASEDTVGRSGALDRVRRIGPWTGIAIAALVVSALTLLYPSTPTYDPWAWIIWGREITQFDLVTTSGPSWKPLPVLFTTPFALFGGAAPDLWLVIARAGGLVALAAGFRVATRLVEVILDGRVTRWQLPAVFAGAATVGALIVQSEFVKATALGNSEGLLIAAVLLAFDRALDGNRRDALLFGAAAGLMRPEIWVFLGPYGVYVLWKDRQLRPLVFAVGVALPALWFIPEYLGSGDFFRAANRAKDLSYLPYSPALAPDPTREILDMTELMLPETVWMMAVVGFVLALVPLRRRVVAPLVFALMPIAWIGLVVQMTESGYAGNPRYLLLGTAMACVLAGAAFGTVIGAGSLLAARLDTRLALPATLVLFAAGVAIGWNSDVLLRFERWERLDSYLRNEEVHRSGLPAAIALAGGSDRVVECGQMTTNNFQVPMVAWYLGVHQQQVGLDPAGPGTTFQTKTTPRSVPDPPGGPAGGRELGVREPWTVFQLCDRPVGGG